jgi:hypothetical protein
MELRAARGVGSHDSEFSNIRLTEGGPPGRRFLSPPVEFGGGSVSLIRSLKQLATRTLLSLSLWTEELCCLFPPASGNR